MINVLPTYRLPICANGAEIDPGWVPPPKRFEYDLVHKGNGSTVGMVLVDIVSLDSVTWHWFLFDPTAPQAPIVPGSYPIPDHGQVTFCFFRNERPWSFQLANWRAQRFPARTEYHRTVTDRLY